MRVIVIQRMPRLTMDNIEAALKEVQGTQATVLLVKPAVSQASGLRRAPIEGSGLPDTALARVRTLLVDGMPLPLWLYRGGRPDVGDIALFGADVRDAVSDVVILADPTNIAGLLNFVHPALMAVSPVLDDGPRQQTKDFFARVFREFTASRSAPPLIKASERETRAREHYLNDPKILFEEGSQVVLELNAAALSSKSASLAQDRDRAQLGLVVPSGAPDGLIFASESVHVMAGPHVVLVALVSGVGPPDGGQAQPILLDIDLLSPTTAAVLMTSRVTILPFGGSQQLSIPFVLAPSNAGRDVSVRIWKMTGNIDIRFTLLCLLRTVEG